MHRTLIRTGTGVDRVYATDSPVARLRVRCIRFLAWPRRLTSMQSSTLADMQTTSVFLLLVVTMVAHRHPYMFWILTFTSDVEAHAVTRSNPTLHPRGATPDEQTSASWSKEAIFTLVGVCVTVFGLLVGLLSSPKLRLRLCRPFTCKRRSCLPAAYSTSLIYF